MRIPPWTPDVAPRPAQLVDAIRSRRGGQLLNLDRALLWSEPLARGWNTYLGAVRTGLATDRRLRELAICTVALLTGAHYEYHHHAPDFVAAGGEPDRLEQLRAWCAQPGGPLQAPPPPGLGGETEAAALDALVIRYAAAMTLTVQVPPALSAALQDRLGTTGLVELTAAIATYNMVARFLVALDIEPEAP